MRRSLVPFLVILFAAPLIAQSGVWGSRGISRKFVVSGSRLYSAEGRGVGVFDISNPSAPSRLDAATVEDETTDLALMDDSHLVSMTDAGLDRWAIAAKGTLSRTATVARRGFTAVAANATTVAAATASRVFFYDTDLQATGSLAVPATINAMLYRGTTLILALDGVGIEFVDAAGNTTILAEQAHDLALSGDLLYAAGGARGLVTIDVRDTPRLFSRTGAGEVNFTRVAASGSTVYTVENDSTIRIYDTSTGEPRLTSTFTQPVRAIAASGASLFLSGVDTPLRAFAGDKPLGQLDERSVEVSGVAISKNGSIAYVVDPPYLRVLDISTTTSPHEVASLLLNNIEDHIKINGAGTRVVLYNRGAAQLVDVTNPYKPKLIGVWQSGGRTPSRAGFLGDYVVEANWTTGFHVLDFDHYSTPAIIGSLIFDYWDLETLPDGSAAYVTAELSTIATIDVADPHHPHNPHTLLLHMIEGAFADANDGHAALLLARTPDGVHLLTLADPLAPAEVSAVAFEDGEAIAADGQTAYIAISGAVTMMDVTNAAQPAISASTLRVTAPAQMAAAAGKLVVADTYSLRVYGPNTAPLPLPQPARRRPSRP